MFQSKMFCYLVTFNGDKRRVAVEEKPLFLNEVEKVFGCTLSPNQRLRFEDPDWDGELVTVDKAQELPDKAKVTIDFPPEKIDQSPQISEYMHLCQPPDLSAYTVSQSSPSLQSSSSTELSSLSQSSGSSQSSILSQPLHSSQVLVSTCEGSPGPSCPKKIALQIARESAKNSIPVPSNYIFPYSSLPNDVREKLLAKACLKEYERSSIFAALYDDLDINFNKVYLTGNEYGMLAESLLKAHPYLECQESQNFAEAKELWRRRIQVYFKNRRVRRDRQRPDVAIRTNKLITVKLDENRSKKVANLWGLPNFAPERPAGEDDTSIEKHKAWMADQNRLEPQARDVSGIELRMRQTLADRRTDVIQGIHLEVLKERYPLLFNTKELLAEFTRLAGTSYEENFRGQLRKYMTGLTQLPVSRKGRNASRAVEPAFVRELKEEIKSARLESDRQRYVEMLGLLLIPIHLKERVNLLLVQTEKDTDDSSPPATPVITFSKPLIDDQVFSIVCEGVEICSTSSLCQAYFVLVASYFVFNLRFPVGLEGTLTFVQKVFNWPHRLA